MINTNMRSYTYSTLGAVDAYGQPTINNEPVGTIKMSINLLNQATQDNVLYNNATYVGLTKQEVNDTFVINYGTEKLKVLYVNTYGRYNQVFLCQLN